MLSAIHRLQLATRIQLALRREGGARVEVLRMLREPRYARRVLARCHAGTDFSLCTLADDFGDTLAADDVERELARAAASTRAALARLPLGEGAAIVRGPVRDPVRRHEAVAG